MIFIYFLFIQTNVLDSDDDEDIVDNPSVVDSKVGNVITPLFFVNFFNFYYAFLRSLSLHTYLFFRVADSALRVPQVFSHRWCVSKSRWKSVEC